MYSRYMLRLVHFIERTYLISGNGTPSPRNGSVENDQHQKMINMVNSENDQHI